MLCLRGEWVSVSLLRVGRGGRRIVVVAFGGLGSVERSGSLARESVTGVLGISRGACSRCRANIVSLATRALMGLSSFCNMDVSCLLSEAGGRGVGGWIPGRGGTRGFLILCYLQRYSVVTCLR